MGTSTVGMRVWVLVQTPHTDTRITLHGMPSQSTNGLRYQWLSSSHPLTTLPTPSPQMDANESMRCGDLHRLAF